MKLDHCNRSSCAQIIEALRAELEELTQERDELDREFGGEHRLYLTCKYELAATNAKVEELTHCYAIECANHKSSRDQLVAMTKERDEYNGLYLYMIDFLQDIEARETELAAMTKERDDAYADVEEADRRCAAKDAVIERLREFVQLLADYIPASAVGNITVQQALALAITNDSSALEARLAQEREKIRAEMINEAWSKIGEERSMK